VIQRGQIWWADLEAPRASEPGYRRPVLVIQSDDFNRSRINTVIAIALTSNLRLAEAPGNVLLSSKETGLEKDSVANVSQIVTLDKDFLTEKVHRLPNETMQEIEDGIRLVLSL